MRALSFYPPPASEREQPLHSPSPPTYESSHHRRHRHITDTHSTTAIPHSIHETRALHSLPYKNKKRDCSYERSRFLYIGYNSLLVIVCRYNRYIRTVLLTFAEYYRTVYQSEQRVVFTHTYVLTRVMYCTSLTYQNVSGFGILTTENFDTQSFAFRFTTVLRTTNTFLMCHFLRSLIGLSNNFFN